MYERKFVIRTRQLILPVSGPLQYLTIVYIHPIKEQVMRFSKKNGLRRFIRSTIFWKSGSGGARYVDLNGAQRTYPPTPSSGPPASLGLQFEHLPCTLSTFPLSTQYKADEQSNGFFVREQFQLFGVTQSKRKMIVIVIFGARAGIKVDIIKRSSLKNYSRAWSPWN